MIYSKLAGLGTYLPKKVLTNKDFEKTHDTSDEWILSRTGISERHIAEKIETPTSMGMQAAQEALKKAGCVPEDIDMIIVSTATPEKFFPSTACMLQKELNINECAALDISTACSGFVYGLSIADQFIKTGMMKRVLVVSSEILSRLTDWTDRSTCVLFGDGAGAVVLEASDKPGILATKLYANGACGDMLYCNTEHFSENPDVRNYLHMNGRGTFKLAIESMARACNEILAEQNIQSQQVDWVITHQANKRIIDALLDRLNVSQDKSIITINKYANTSSSTIPLALGEAMNDGRVKLGQLILLVAFGAGMTFGSALVRL